MAVYYDKKKKSYLIKFSKQLSVSDTFGGRGLDGFGGLSHPMCLRQICKKYS